VDLPIQVPAGGGSGSFDGLRPIARPRHAAGSAMLMCDRRNSQCGCWDPLRASAGWMGSWRVRWAGLPPPWFLVRRIASDIRNLEAGVVGSKPGGHLGARWGTGLLGMSGRLL